MKTLHCKAKYVINLKPDPTLPDAGDLILLYNYPKLRTLICATENRPFLLKHLKYRVTNRTELCECPFLARPFYLIQTMFSCQNNAAEMDSLLSTDYIFKNSL